MTFYTGSDDAFQTDRTAEKAVWLSVHWALLNVIRQAYFCGFREIERALLRSGKPGRGRSDRICRFPVSRSLLSCV